jgi:hypothetical protein
MRSTIPDKSHDVTHRKFTRYFYLQFPDEIGTHKRYQIITIVNHALENQLAHIRRLFVVREILLLLLGFQYVIQYIRRGTLNVIRFIYFGTRHNYLSLKSHPAGTYRTLLQYIRITLLAGVLSTTSSTTVTS